MAEALGSPEQVFKCHTIKPFYLREDERCSEPPVFYFTLHKTDASAPLAQPQAATGVRGGAKGGCQG